MALNATLPWRLGLLAQSRSTFADWKIVRLLKLLLTVAMIGALVMMWNGRDRVLLAYTGERAPVDLRLDGLDLAVARTDIEPSPYRLSRAPDLRRAVATGFAASSTRPPNAPPGIAGGAASISGVVNGPEGAVVGATVRIERHTSEGSETLDLFTDSEGSWALSGMRGGRYRVRSFVPGELTSGAADVFFLIAGQSVVVDSFVAAAADGIAIALVGPDTIYFGLSDTVAVTIATSSIDAEGRVVSLPLPGQAVSGSVNQPATLLSEGTVVSDGGGASRFLVRCDGLGVAGLTVSFQVGEVFQGSSLALPRCIPVPEPDPEEEVAELDSQEVDE